MKIVRIEPTKELYYELTTEEGEILILGEDKINKDVYLKVAGGVKDATLDNILKEDIL